MQNESNIIKSLISVSSGEADILFLTICGVVLSAIIANMLLCFLLKNYNYLKRSWYIITSIGIDIFYLGAWLINSQSIIKIFFLISEEIFGLIPFFLIDTKKESKENIEIEEEKKKEDYYVEKIKVEPRKEKINGNNEIDFSHIKGVIDKLEYYDITEEEKEKIRELEGYIYRAEQGEEGLLKGKINDGLGQLLKIMAKYGV